LVERGQILERMCVVPYGENDALEGLLRRGRGPAVVLVASTAALGGTMDGPILTELVWASARAGGTTLRVNLPGEGASTGALLHHSFDPEEAIAEMRAAPAALRLATAMTATLETAYAVHDAPVHVVGHGLGAIATEHVATDPRVATLTWISPIVSAAAANSSIPRHIVVAEDDIAGVARWRAAQSSSLVVEILPGADPSFRRGLTRLGHSVAHRLFGAVTSDDRETGGSTA